MENFNIAKVRVRELKGSMKEMYKAAFSFRLSLVGSRLRVCEAGGATTPMLSSSLLAARSATLTALQFSQRKRSLKLHRSPTLFCAPVARISPSALMAHQEGKTPQEAAISLNSMVDEAGLGPSSLVVVSFYQFAKLSEHMAMRKHLAHFCQLNRVSGGIILAPEGINGSICGTRTSISKVLEAIRVDIGLRNLRLTEASAGLDAQMLPDGHDAKSPLGAGENAPFRWDHVRVKVKEEIVPLGLKGIDPSKQVGKYVKPKDWNTLICDPETILVDVRNAYETRIGKFKGAVDPKTSSFRDFPLWAEHNLLQLHKSSDVFLVCKDGCLEPNDKNCPLKSCKPSPCLSSAVGQVMPPTDNLILNESPATKRRVAMYCTGGIRCEKSTSLLLSMGFKEVYHLEGGILKYLEEIHPTESLWEGECFVFDKRVSVGHGLKVGNYELCYACKKPVSESDKLSIYWEDGISCPYCFFQKTESERDRARARQTQFERFGVIGGPGKGS
ncbi:hypothetical protein O6H91_Y342100 [Diphasiastrum complanatum]|nr:hypothetical protein O6H91_Y342100 [Diphasiastrum complanatum]